MANEISIIAKLTASKGGTTVTNATSSDSIDMAGTNMCCYIQNIGTTAEALTMTDINTGSAYRVLLRNKDDTNYVDISFDSGSTFPVQILPGEICGPIMRPSGSIHARANTAAIELEIVAAEA